MFCAKGRLHMSKPNRSDDVKIERRFEISDAESELSSGICCNECGTLNPSGTLICIRCGDSLAEQGSDLRARLERISRRASSGKKLTYVPRSLLQVETPVVMEPDYVPMRQGIDQQQCLERIRLRTGHVGEGKPVAISFNIFELLGVSLFYVVVFPLVSFTKALLGRDNRQPPRK